MKSNSNCSLGELHEVLSIEALRCNKRGAEYAVLEALKDSIVQGRIPDPVFQNIANAIVAKAVICGKFPSVGKGRPMNDFMTGPPGMEIARRHIGLMDGGKTYEEATTVVASEFFLGERRIQQIVRENKCAVERMHGNTKDEREMDRIRRSTTHEVSAEEQEVIDSILKMTDEATTTFQSHFANETRRDLIQELDRAIEKLLNQ